MLPILSNPDPSSLRPRSTKPKEPGSRSANNVDALISDIHPLPKLPHEIWLQILAFLGPGALTKLRSADRGWRKRADDASLWRALCLAQDVEPDKLIRYHRKDKEECDGSRTERDSVERRDDDQIDWKSTFIAHYRREKERSRRFWAGHECLALQQMLGAVTSPRGIPDGLLPVRRLVPVPVVPCEQCEAEKVLMHQLGFWNPDVPYTSEGSWSSVATVYTGGSSTSDALRAAVVQPPLSRRLSRASVILHTLTSGCDLANGLKDFVPRMQVVNDVVVRRGSGGHGVIVLPSASGLETEEILEGILRLPSFRN
ncbi:uncharacterized protein SPPG_07943 [Spizellomyces punctatus DAOM BR117]|uniref:F-box domain-containing protein n=1 Tax=Spizellomyces punctatus (strain DAOM BR117) TaxID=645134 RepID=A0A0L0H5F2_SPIPD|nr:uncharacterized protein SPPG_07943 [Spizellomyces punctatus DAOM BR117]KNC96735.1 hypothetical protein SPPG_07943 [Spizellomyces punctatus DAOM BR117]|eukprot:XP_016604775.1 hypothetical protein SPPG_07943 [Spizellomyces punctatus DAOM BR117]